MTVREPAPHTARWSASAIGVNPRGAKFHLQTENIAADSSFSAGLKLHATAAKRGLKIIGEIRVSKRP